MVSKWAAPILILDDKPSDLHFISEVLTQARYRVQIALMEQMVIEPIAASPPSTILLDTDMPRIDSYEVCQRLNQCQMTCHIPVIFLGSFSQALDRLRIYQVGGVECSAKPFLQEELIDDLFERTIHLIKPIA